MVRRPILITVFLVALCASGGAAAGTAPTAVTVSPAVVAQGGVVHASASGFIPGATVTFELDGATQASVVSDAHGAVSSVALPIPAAMSTGSHTLTALDPVSGASADALFAVVAQEHARLLDDSFNSRGVGVLRLSVYLPAGYDSGTKRYPVIYFLHGLPAGESAYRSWGATIGQAMARVPSDAIVVTPQAARTGDADPEYLDWSPRREWATAIAVELPAYVDTHYRTIQDRRGRALIGVSAGGYGATELGLTHLRTFGVIESWSGYFRPTDPDGTRTLDLGSSNANAQASAYTLVPRLKRLFLANPTFLAFFVGRSDTLFAGDNFRFQRRLVAASVPHAFAALAGGHQTQFWSNHEQGWLTLAVRHLAQPG
jgi:enterochelin esterase-like enzyme